MKFRATLKRFVLAALLVLATSPALAHSASEAGNGLLNGMAHPISGDGIM